MMPRLRNPSLSELLSAGSRANSASEGYGPPTAQALPSSAGRADGPERRTREAVQVRRGSGWSGDLASTRGLGATSRPRNGKETVAPHRREEHGPRGGWALWRGGTMNEKKTGTPPPHRISGSEG